MVELARYLRPKDMPEALAMAEKFQPQLLAGGTDFYAGLADRGVVDDVLDLSSIAELKEILSVRHADSTFLRIGAMATWSDVLHHPALSIPAFLALRQCAREVGGQQIQNRGTLIGNICNASPAADGVPVLMALGASLEIRSSKARRWASLENLIKGPRKLSLEPGEIVTAVELPLADAKTRSLFLKFGSRRYLVISVAMLGAQWQRGKTPNCRIAIGACSPVARRLAPLERWFLDGMKAQQKMDALTASLDILSPLDDVRADREYRRSLAQSLCDKLILEMESETAYV